MRNKEEGKIGWILLWLLGIPIPILLVLYLLRGCTRGSTAGKVTGVRRWVAERSCWMMMRGQRPPPIKLEAKQ